LGGQPPAILQRETAVEEVQLSRTADERPTAAKRPLRDMPRYIGAGRRWQWGPTPQTAPASSHIIRRPTLQARHDAVGMQLAVAAAHASR